MAKTKEDSKRVSSLSPTTAGSASVKPTGGSSSNLCQPILGVSKLKSQLRQANRLLQKDALSPELRQTTLLKISQLQDAIQNNPKKDQERRNAIKYHRIKFFDRKKVTRRLKQVIKELEQLNLTEKPKKSKKRKLEEQVEQLRVDLNYVRHYPKHLKYVALFPGGEYKNHEPKSTTTTTDTTTVTLPETIPSSKEPDLLRNYVRNYIFKSMLDGILTKTPELIPHEDVIDDDDLLADPSSANLSLEHDDFFEP